MQAQETEIMHPCNKAIDTREEILDLITSTSRSARESELRPRIAKHLSGRVRPPGASMPTHKITRSQADDCGVKLNVFSNLQLE